MANGANTEIPSREDSCPNLQIQSNTIQIKWSDQEAHRKEIEHTAELESKALQHARGHVVKQLQRQKQFDTSCFLNSKKSRARASKCVVCTTCKPQIVQRDNFMKTSQDTEKTRDKSPTDGFDLFPPPEPNSIVFNSRPGDLMRKRKELLENDTCQSVPEKTNVLEPPHPALIYRGNSKSTSIEGSAVDLTLFLSDPQETVPQTLLEKLKNWIFPKIPAHWVVLNY
jgi:hypothetical protein